MRDELPTELDSILSRMVLETESSDRRGKYIREWALDKLQMDKEINDHIDQYIRLRIALSLCPTSAITHSKSERLSRAEKIEEHLITNEFSGKESATQLAAVLDSVLDKWLTQREDVSQFRDALFLRDGKLCRSCRVDLQSAPAIAESVRRRDRYKLIWLDPERHLQATVDHRVPVSRFGTNELGNLELLCRFCNEGKADGAPMHLKHEVELGTQLPISRHSTGVEVPGGVVAKSAMITYRVLRRDEFQCSQCEQEDSELTIRKVCETGLAVISNLRAVCYPCIGGV
ncbi:MULTISPECIES: HNH endonuclease signature motif containing protein [Rhodococcus]|uniref:HNH endonuclease signature motif containing protein n=1 Tax=Rhodococcus oxybenzonivorans TaxID=1990687 RepID=A0AAE5A7F4_9NOCA|nr:MULTISPECIES: HNH endonuclease signature motif containing protein [Rhodococcus]MDV7245319.1 HNH endonuclease signature motif containing protein [Rhodococcus oxybenzonivorans]MDV7266108.1 HNH endonuclease signature motif containing protein [Rhodococcus oxybenzonivorans]MDV7272401.1 HNH endonuclease signature motif containing protein [Rhodococcus oxybenzonivorans]MDV7336344.1 HNH endonuclease signature motif containing protein [Rhodococcus oxybenzonivorans]MDV7347644.1 HNH endonuclease signat